VTVGKGVNLFGARSLAVPWGAVATLTGEGLSRVAMSLFQFLVANSLGAAGYGGLGLILSYASVLLPFADLGLNGLALRHLANNPDPSAFRKPFALKLTATALYLIVLFLGAFLHPHPETGIWALTLAGVFCAFTSLSDFMRQALRAKEASLREFHARLAYLALFIPGCLAFWYWRPGLTGTLLVYALPVAGLSVAYLLPLLRVFPHLTPDWRGGFSLLATERRFLGQALLYLLLVNASSRVDLWILDWGMGRASVGYYFAAYNMIFSGIFFGQALSAHMYPRLHRPGNAKTALRRALLAHAGLGLFFFAAIFLLGKPIFGVIYRQAGFAEGAALLNGLGLLLALSVFNYLWLSLVMGRNAQWISVLALIFILAVKVVLGIRWVPLYGAMGMLHASLWAEIPACLVSGVAACWVYLRGRRSGDGQITVGEMR
jgi:O-antigen/teichoic acid export membrane protein